jgi:methyl-accepting chemotaxis protein
MSLRNINIAPRASLGFGLVALLVLLLGGFSLIQMDQARKQSELINENWLPSIMSLGQLNQDILRLRALTMRLVIINDENLQRETLVKADDIKSSLDKLDATYSGLISSAEEQSIYDRFRQAERAYLQEQGKVITAVRQGDRDAAEAVFDGPINEHADTIAQALAELLEHNRVGAVAATEVADKIFASSRLWVMVMVILALVLTVILAILLTRSIVAPLAEAVRYAEVVAGGNLSQSIEVHGTDEPARLLGALKNMQQSLRSTIQGIYDSSTQLASASEELSAVTENSTHGLHQQNNEIEQAATAVTEMTSASEEVARNAVDTSEATKNSNRTAQHGREQVRQTVDSISHLAEDVTKTASEVEQLAGKVRDISKVLDVIRSIAEQTNLLALNAAIEAARAGDAGRGFAVVADEVRALAHRTQQSTQEIEQMVGGIQQGTDRAVSAMQSSNSRAHSTLDVAKAAGQALDEIAEAISQINERNLVIASAAEEQAQVAREVDRNLVNIRV